MCSKKDYVAIAAIIKQNRPGALLPDGELILTELAKDLCEYFERDNPRFDIIRFMKATRS